MIGLIIGVVAAILGLIIPGLAATLAAAFIGVLFRHNGDFADAQTNPEAGSISPGDYVVVVGAFVYDGGHKEGWHELHPVRTVYKIPDANQTGVAVGPVAALGLGASPTLRERAATYWDEVCAEHGKRLKPGTTAAQALPENSWNIHPLVDGCRSNPVGEPPR